MKRLEQEKLRLGMLHEKLEVTDGNKDELPKLKNYQDFVASVRVPWSSTGDSETKTKVIQALVHRI